MWRGVGGVGINLVSHLHMHMDIDREIQSRQHSLNIYCAPDPVLGHGDIETNEVHF